MTQLLSEIGLVKWNDLVAPRAFVPKGGEPDPAAKPKYTIKLEFTGEAADKMAMLLLANGKSVPGMVGGKMKDGKLSLNFNRPGTQSKPIVVDKDKKTIDLMQNLARDTKARVIFTTRPYIGGVALVLETVQVLEMGGGPTYTVESFDLDAALAML